MFRIFIVSIHSGDIRDQSRKLLLKPENRVEFQTFFALLNFVWGTPCKISVHVITPASKYVAW